MPTPSRAPRSPHPPTHLAIAARASGNPFGNIGNKIGKIGNNIGNDSGNVIHLLLRSGHKLDHNFGHICGNDSGNDSGNIGYNFGNAVLLVTGTDPTIRPRQLLKLSLVTPSHQLRQDLRQQFRQKIGNNSGNNFGTVPAPFRPLFRQKNRPPSGHHSGHPPRRAALSLKGGGVGLGLPHTPEKRRRALSADILHTTCDTSSISSFTRHDHRGAGMSAVTALPKRGEVRKDYTWNLESIYATDADWEADFARVVALLPEVRAYEGKLGDSGDVLLEAFTKRDHAYELWGRLFVYANMRMHEDSTNSTYQGLADRATTLANDLNTATAYMTPEILALPQERIDAFLDETPGLQLYRHALDEINRQRAHVLSSEMEALLAQAAELGNAPEHVYEMLNNADLKLPVVADDSGQQVRLTQGNYVAKFLESHDRNVRRAAFEAMMGTYRSFRNTLGATYSAQVKRDIFFARARNYQTSLEAALDPNNIPTSVYDNLVATVDQNLPKLHRYLSLRKRLLGLDDLHMYDLYVPMVREVEYKVAFDEAKERVAQALAPLGTTYVEPLTKGFASRWIDVYENEGKRSGAYSWGSYGTQPFVLLNYQDSMDSMFTLAHEMGHSMHSYFTWQTQPFPYSSYTLFVAEVASTLNEALLTHYLLQETTDRPLRMYIINHALETFRTTLYRQTLFAEFERDAHARAEAGEALTPELLSSTFKGLNDKYYGAAVTVDELIENEWARIPHFYSSFYVYQYATGISASAALARQIIDEGAPAVERYRRFLSSGSSDYSINLLRDAGVDLSTPQPIQQALDTFAGYLDQLEALL